MVATMLVPAGLLGTMLVSFSDGLADATQRRLAMRPFDEWLPTVSPGWPWKVAHLVLVRDYLELVTAGEIDRLMIVMPPRHLKSEHVTVRYTAWRLEYDPTLSVIVAGYNQTLASRFSRKIRRIARDRIALNDERTAVHEWETTAGGGLRAAGVGSGVTGMGAKLIVIDDPIKSRMEADSPTYRDRVWEWYTDDIYTRQEPGAAIILIQTRWHEDDLAGRILASDDGPNWTVLHLPAIAAEPDEIGRQPGDALYPEQYPVEVLERIRSSTSERTWWSLYQGMPQSQSGNLYQREWWAGCNRYRVDDRALLARSVARFISWDTAESIGDDAAYTAGVVGDLVPHNRGYVLLIREVWRGRVAFANLLTVVTEVATRWNHDGKLREVIIEDASSGKAGAQMLRLQAPPWLRPHIRSFPPRQSKDVRGRLAAIPMRQGRVWLPEPDTSVPWLFDFESEVYSVPSGRYRDQTDALAQLTIYARNYLREPGAPAVPENEAA